MEPPSLFRLPSRSENFPQAALQWGPAMMGHIASLYLATYLKMHIHTVT